LPGFFFRNEKETSAGHWEAIVTISTNIFISKNTNKISNNKTNKKFKYNKIKDTYKMNNVIIKIENNNESDKKHHLLPQNGLRIFSFSEMKKKQGKGCEATSRGQNNLSLKIAPFVPGYNRIPPKIKLNILFVL
jgi:hypothetical protein